MSPDLKRRWVAAMRDPSRVRGEGYLCERSSSDGVCRQCPVGILYEVAGFEAKPFLQRISGWVPCSYEDLSEIFVPTRDRLEEWGITDAQAEEIYRLNDLVHLSLPEMADWVEANL